MVSAVSTNEICAAWASIVCSRRLDRWHDIPDDALPIPESWIQTAAYFLFVDRGCEHGFDLDDWFEAKRTLVQQFRELVDDFLDEDGPPERNSSVDSSDPESMEHKSGCCAHDEIGGFTVCQRGGKDGKMGNMNLRDITEQDSEVRSAVLSVRAYRDPFTFATPEELEHWRNKVIAILPETGEVIAVAESVQELRILVAESEYHGQTWRLMDGPSGQIPLSLKEAEQGGS